MKQYILFIGLIILLFQNVKVLHAQDDASVPSSKSSSPTTGAWFGFYTKYKVADRLFYYGEYHLRRREGLSEMGQIYLRVGLSWIVNNHLELTGGFVNPYYWASNPEDANVDRVVPQYRGWQQAVFIEQLGRAKIYHQIRLEQRFRRDYEKGSPFKFTHRFRYKFTTYIPINKKSLQVNTLFGSMYNEIFIQAGRPVVYNHFEDNRLFFGLGYILNENLQTQAGYMWTWRHDSSPYEYQSRHIFRISFYHNMDLRR